MPQFLTNAFFSESKTLLLLAIPLMVAQFAEASFGFFSTILLAHLGHHALAAGGLVWSLFITLMVLVWGIFLSIGALVAQRHGAKDIEGVAQVLLSGLYLAFFLSIPSMLVLWNAAPIFSFFGQSPEMIIAARAYLHGLVWSLTPDLLSLVLLQFCVGLGHTRVALIFNVLWVSSGLLVSYLLMFGKWGAPNIGIAGTGWGVTVGVCIATLFITLYIFLKQQYRCYLSALKQQKPFRYIGRILKAGLPVASMFCLEIGFFLAIALLMGFLGNQILAAYQIVNQFLWLFSSMFIFCMAQALTVRIGHCVGANNFDALKLVSHAGTLISMLIMLVVAVVYWFVPQILIGIDLNTQVITNQIIIYYAKQFFVIAAIFQIIEAIRFTAFGALRGMSETRISMVVSLFAFWCIAFPLGYFLAVRWQWSGNGVWWGMVLGASFGAILLQWRLHYVLKNRMVNHNK